LPKGLRDLAEPVERALSQVRAWVEHPFHIVKNRFRHKKLRYRGLAKNTAQRHTLFAFQSGDHQENTARWSAGLMPIGGCRDPGTAQGEPNHNPEFCGVRPLASCLPVSENKAIGGGCSDTQTLLSVSLGAVHAEWSEMEFSVYLEVEIEECLAQLRKLSFQLQVDTTYVNAPGYDPGDIQFFRCQVELATLQKQYVAQRLALLRQWLPMSAYRSWV
jgi:hypothetical protein